MYEAFQSLEYVHCTYYKQKFTDFDPKILNFSDCQSLLIKIGVLVDMEWWYFFAKTFYYLLVL